MNDLFVASIGVGIVQVFLAVFGIMFYMYIYLFFFINKFFKSSNSHLLPGQTPKVREPKNMRSTTFLAPAPVRLGKMGPKLRRKLDAQEEM